MERLSPEPWSSLTQGRATEDLGLRAWELGERKAEEGAHSQAASRRPQGFHQAPQLELLATQSVSSPGSPSHNCATV